MKRGLMSDMRCFPLRAGWDARTAGGGAHGVGGQARGRSCRLRVDAQQRVRRRRGVWARGGRREAVAWQHDLLRRDRMAREPKVLTFDVVGTLIDFESGLLGYLRRACPGAAGLADDA